MTELPLVVRCAVSECFFYREGQCHAPAINVGKAHQQCDTFMSALRHTARQGIALVGACQITTCRYNADRMCVALTVVVAHHQDHADCDTYRPCK